MNVPRSQPRSHAYVALGSNLDNPVDQVCKAMAALSRLPRTRVDGCSSLYRTAPVGPIRQPDFINAVCRLVTTLSPETLMQHLLAIEAQHGRVRAGQKWGPRTLDLDLLLYDQLALNTPSLVLPHPRLHERAFVLYPLAELDQGLVIPGRGPVSELVHSCADQRLEKLDRQCG